MLLLATFGRPIYRAAALILALVFALMGTMIAQANVGLTQISSDPFTNSTSQHKTEVEPDTFAFGNTIVAATQAGRFFDGGASDIGWATSKDGGAHWTHGFLPGITVYASGPYDRVSDPSVAYDAKYDVWLISSLAFQADGSQAAVVTSISSDGGLTWGGPVTVASSPGADKNWIVCDNSTASPFYGNCYTEWDDFGNGNLIHMNTSTDGGLTWGPSLTTANNATGIGGQPLVQPNGRVIVPIDNAFETALLSFTSADGGASWSRTVKVTNIRAHRENGNLRSSPLPSAEIDGAGKVYVVWQDCRFILLCRANDIVMTTTTDGVTWSRVTRIPIDATNSGVDHFIPGLGVDPTTTGSSVHLGLAYYYYPQSMCTTGSCQLEVGFVASSDGGTSWSTPTQLAAPMSLSWLANTNQGVMVGDYISTSFAGGTAHPVFAVANPPSGGVFDEAIYTPKVGLTPPSGATIRVGGEQAVPDTGSDQGLPSRPLSAH